MSTLTGRNPSERSERRFALRWLIWANVVALLAVAIFFRAWRLDHVPGINGDEAWMGVQAQRWIDGQLETLTTPTGNVLNVFHFGPQVVLHTFCKPSIGLLRLPVLISGLMALLVNYLLCSYTFGRRPAVWSSVALAVLPINIAYCRFAWDASQTVLFSLPVIYFSLLAVQRRQQPIRWLAHRRVISGFCGGGSSDQRILGPVSSECPIHSCLAGTGEKHLCGQKPLDLAAVVANVRATDDGSRLIDLAVGAACRP